MLLQPGFDFWHQFSIAIVPTPVWKAEEKNCEHAACVEGAEEVTVPKDQGMTVNLQFEMLIDTGDGGGENVCILLILNFAILELPASL